MLVWFGCVMVIVVLMFHGEFIYSSVCVHACNTCVLMLVISCVHNVYQAHVHVIPYEKKKKKEN